MADLSIIGSGNKKKRRDLVAELNAKYSGKDTSKETKTKPTKQKIQNLENKLGKDLEGKPKISLTPLENTVVYTPIQQRYDLLMQIYECGGWKWSGGNLPTELDHWERYKEETWVESKEKFGCCHKAFYKNEGYKVISTKEFYSKQKITQDQIKEINKYFKNKK